MLSPPCYARLFSLPQLLLKGNILFSPFFPFELRQRNTCSDLKGTQKTRTAVLIVAVASLLLR